MASEWRCGLLAASALLVLPGCDLLPPEAEKYWVLLEKAWNGKEASGPAPMRAVSPSPSSPPQELTSPNARNAKANAELLHEVYQVVFLREPKDRIEFGNLVDSMNQGASVEGMYNGFTHSAEYRKLELASGGASPQALRAFGEELAALELDLSATAEAQKPEQKQLAERYSSQFVGASVFTLKRVLGDEALRVATLKKEYPEKLALWYSRWVVQMASRGVDFGIALRNQPDEQFHYKWALTAGEDRIRWEILNRVHRVLNEANRRKQ